MSLKDDLIAAKALIGTPEKWSAKGAMTFQAGGHAICAWIALHRAINTTGERLMGAYDAMFRALPWQWRLRARFSGDVRDAWIIRFNDHRKTTHATVLAWFDRAIEAAT